jgi:hypothetical protein
VHSQTLLSYFTEHPTVQNSSLDDAGAPPSTRGTRTKAIEIELVDGKREELYWMKVPDRVRVVAVERWMQLDLEVKNANVGDDEDMKGKGKKREGCELVRDEGKSEHANGSVREDGVKKRRR